MADVIESISLELKHNSSNAENEINRIASALGKLKDAANFTSLKTVNTHLSEFNLISGKFDVDHLNNASVAMINMSNALSTFDAVDPGKFSSLATSLSELPNSLQALRDIDLTATAQTISDIVQSAEPLTNISGDNMRGFIDGFSHLPETFQNLENVDIPRLRKNVTDLADALSPLAEIMQRVGGAAEYMRQVLPENMRIPNIPRNMTNITSRGSSGGGISHLFGKRGTSILSNFGKSFGKFVTLPFRNFGNSVQSAYQRYSKFAKRLGSIALYRAVRSAINLITSGIKEGVDNLYQWSKAMNGTFASSLDSLATNSLYLRNSLATIAEPIINAVAPAIDWLTGKIVTLINVIAQLFAMLGGSSTYTKAIKQNKEYAAAAGSGAGGAAKAAKELQKTLLGFDELNLLNDNSSGGGGGGGGAGGIDYGSMFETANVDTSLFDRFKNAFEQSGFYGLGEEIGKTLNSINSTVDDWIVNKLEPKSVQWAANIGNLLNGIVSAFNGTLLGKTIGDGLNAIIHTANKFYETFDNLKLGQKIGETMNGFFDTVDWVGLGDLVANKINATLDRIQGVVSTFDWKKAGESLSTTIDRAFKGIKWDVLASNITTTVKGAFDFGTAFMKGIDWHNGGQTIAEFIKEVIKGIPWKSIESFFASTEKAVFDFAKGFLDGLDTRELPSKIYEKIKTVIEEIPWRDLPSIIAEHIGSVFDIAIDIALGLVKLEAKVLDDVVGWFGGKIESTIKFWKGLFDGSFFSNIFGKISQFDEKAASLESGIPTALDKIGTAFSNTVEKGFTFSGLFDEISDAFDSSTTSMKKSYKSLGETWRDTGKRINSEAEDINEIIKEQQSKYNDLFKSCKTSLDGQMDLWGDVADKSSVSVNQMIENIRRQTQANNDYLENYRTITNSQIQLSDELLAKLSDGSEEAKTLAQKLAEAIESGQTDLVQTLSEELAKYSESTSSVASATAQTISGIDADLSKMGESASRYESDVVNAFAKAKEELAREGKNAGVSFAEGVQKGLDSIKITKSIELVDYAYLSGAKARASTQGRSAITKKADGGIVPRGDLFIAGENGAELITQTANGNTQVTNRGQFADELAFANNGVIAAVLSTGKAMVEAIINNQPVVNIDSQRITAAQNNTNRRYGRTLQNV